MTNPFDKINIDHEVFLTKIPEILIKNTYSKFDRIAYVFRGMPRAKRNSILQETESKVGVEYRKYIEKQIELIDDEEKSFRY
jgi:hypothetical protein